MRAHLRHKQATQYRREVTPPPLAVPSPPPALSAVGRRTGATAPASPQLEAEARCAGFVIPEANPGFRQGRRPSRACNSASIPPRWTDGANQRHQRQDSNAPGNLHIFTGRGDGTFTSIPTPDKRTRQNQFTVKCIELCGQTGHPPNIGGQSGTKQRPPRCRSRWTDILRVYTEKYFAACEKNKVRILWEPYAGRAETSRPGARRLGACVQRPFNDSPKTARGCRFDPSHLVLAVHGSGAGPRGDFAGKIYDVHLKDTEILWNVVRRGGHSACEQCPRWWRFRVPRLGIGGLERGSSRCWPRWDTPARMNIENEDEFYYPALRPRGTSPSSSSAGSAWAHEFLKDAWWPPVTAFRLGSFATRGGRTASSAHGCPQQAGYAPAMPCWQHFFPRGGRPYSPMLDRFSRTENRNGPSHIPLMDLFGAERSAGSQPSGGTCKFARTPREPYRGNPFSGQFATIGNNRPASDSLRMIEDSAGDVNPCEYRRFQTK